MTRIFTAAFLLIFSQLTFAQKSDNRLRGLESEIKQLVKTYQAVGISVAVVENGQIIYANGFGYRNLEDKLPTTAYTVYPIGSITKSFTASLLGILENKNELSIKDRPAKYIPQLQFFSDKMNHEITISDLLCHRSGIGNADGSYILFPPPNRMALMPRLAHIMPAAPINDSWVYSNMGYVIAGTIVEAASNDCWEHMLQTSILNPLGMQSTSTTIAQMMHTNNYSLGYGMSEGNITKVPFEQLTTESPTGGINSSVMDLTRYMTTWLNDGLDSQKAILPKKYVQEATSMKVIDNGLPPEADAPGVYLFGYGYGWKVNSFKGHYKVHHGGNLSGFSAQMAIFPTDKLGVVVLTNQHNSLLPYIVADIIANRMLRLPQTKLDQYPVKHDEIYKMDSVVKPINRDKNPTHPLSDYCGQFTNAGYGTFEVKSEGDQLFIHFPRDRFRLEHQYYDVFVMKPTKAISQYFNPEFFVHFTLNNEGNISSASINLAEPPIEFVRDTVVRR